MVFEKTVLQVIPELEAGGAERTTVEIAHAITAARGRALVATKGGRLAGEIIAAGGEVFPMPVQAKNPVTIWLNRSRLISLAKAERVDIIHVRSRAPGWSALWAARALQIPLVATYHGAYRASNPAKMLYNSAMARADLVIANSEFTAAAIRAAYPIRAQQLVVIPRGADLSRFDPAGIDNARIAAVTAAWGVDADPATCKLLLPARLTEWKGHKVAIEAVCALAARSLGSGQKRNLQVVFAGDAQGRGEYREALLREIEARGAQGMVHVVGHCADMPAAYAWADIVLSPSTRPEAFGRVAVEAGAMGKPVISSDHGGARETIVDGCSGVLTPPGDVTALSDAIEALAEMSETKRAAMGAAARERVRRRFSTEAMCEATIAAYKRLAS